MSAIEREIDMAARFSESDLPPAGQSEESCLDYLESLQAASSSWDWGKGWISWLQGQAFGICHMGLVVPFVNGRGGTHEHCYAKRPCGLPHDF